jgi:hypothetical protein
MGGKTISTEQQKIANIALQTSSYGLTIPKIYGTQRVSGNLIWYGRFTAVPHTTTTSSGGKGVGKVTQRDTTYSYTAAVMMALGEGAIGGVGAVWKGKDKVSLSDLGLTLFSGTKGQPVWAFLTGYNVSSSWNYEAAYGYKDWYTGATAPFTDQALGYSSTAYLAASAYDLGTDASVPNHGFEVIGSLIYAGQNDANPGDVVSDMLSAPQYGANFPVGMVGSMTVYTQYCVANGLFVSPAYTTQRPTADCLRELTDLTNSAVVWSGSLLKIIPYGDATITGNGQTYTPNLTPVYDLGDDDFLRNGDSDPVRVRRSSPADAKNRITLEFSNRVNQYNTEIVAVEDQDAIEKYGLKPSDNISGKMFCTPPAAKMAAQLQLQRMLYKRNTYNFTLNARYAMLEPMDIVTLTDVGLGMSKVAVRITEITEVNDGFETTAEDLNIGVASAASYAHDSGLRWQMTVNAAPNSTSAPYIFEMPADPTTTGLALGIAVGKSGTDPLYGGCRIWTSLDGTNYKSVGVIYGSSRYGTLTAAYAAFAGIDNTNTMSVSLISGGQLISGSAADAANAATLCIVDNEFLAHQTATLTGLSAYNLKPVNRGLYSSASALHPAGARWARIDQAVQTLPDLDLSLIGKTIYVKCTAFNTYGAGEQSLADATAYTYTITGWAKALETPVDFLTGVGGSTKPANNATRDLPGANEFARSTQEWSAADWAYALGGVAFAANSTAGGWGAFTNSAGRMMLVVPDSPPVVAVGPRVPLRGAVRIWLTVRAAYGGASPPAGLRWAAYWFAADGTYLTNTDLGRCNTSAGTGGYAVTVMSAAAPAGAATVDCRLEDNAQTPAAIWRVDTVSLSFAQPGADITAQNTAADSGALGGVAATSIAASIGSAATTATWGGVTGANKPADNADVTAGVLAARSIADGATRNVNRGLWLSGSPYQMGDIVQDGSPASSYEVVSAHVSAAGNRPPSSNWRVFAAGVTGAAGSPGANGAAGANGLDGAGNRIIYQRLATLPTMPAASIATPPGWYADSNSVPPAATTLWATVGARPNASSNYVWQTPTRFEGSTPTAAAGSVPLAIGTSAALTIALLAGETRAISAVLFYGPLAGGGTATVSLSIEYSVDGSGVWNSLGGSLTSSGTAGDTLDVNLDTGITNSGGAPRRFQVRATGFKGGSASCTGPVIAAQSFVRG